MVTYSDWQAVSSVTSGVCEAPHQDSPLDKDNGTGNDFKVDGGTPGNSGGNGGGNGHGH